MRKRIVALLLVVSVCITNVPSEVFAMESQLSEKLEIVESETTEVADEDETEVTEVEETETVEEVAEEKESESTTEEQELEIEEETETEEEIEIEETRDIKKTTQKDEVQEITKSSQPISCSEPFEDLGVTVTATAKAGSVPEGAQIRIKLEKQEMSEALAKAVLENANQRIETESQVPVEKERNAFNVYTNVQASVSESYDVQTEITYTDENGETCTWIPESSDAIEFIIEQIDLTDQSNSELTDLKDVTVISEGSVNIAATSGDVSASEVRGETSAPAIAVVTYSATADEAMVAAQEKAWDIINTYVDPQYHLEGYPYGYQMTEAEINELKQVATEVVSGCATQYEKIKALTTYVADTIYYDYYNYEGYGDTYVNPYEVYKNKRTVCVGYACLLETLAKMAGIPCMEILGDNHVFNAVYDSDSDKWIFADATWCSGNRYTVEQEWIYGGYNYHMFDLEPKEIAAYTNHEVYNVSGLLDNVYNSVYYSLSTDGDSTIWSDCDWNIRMYEAKEKDVKVVAELAGYPIKRDCFLLCEIVETLDLSEIRMTETSGWTFAAYPNMRTLKLPDTITTINMDAFRNCSALEEIDLSGTKLTKLENSTFNGCTKLKKIKLPSTLETIEGSVFSGCNELEEIDLLNTKVTEIGDWAFTHLTNLKTIKFPKTLENLGANSFWGCTALEKVDLSDTLITKIGDYTFYQCEKLKTIELPSAVKIIGESAFAKSGSLLIVTFPESLQTVGQWAFESCNLSQIDLSKTKLEEIGEYAFARNDTAKIIALPSTITSIGEYAFAANDFYVETMVVAEGLDLNDLYSNIGSVSSWSGRELTVVDYLYTVKFNGNGALSGSMANCMHGSGISYNLPANKFKRTGYTFKGWNTKADGSGKAYANKASVKNLTQKSGGTVTLYAQWEKEKYKITYKLNGGKNNSKNPTAYYNQKITLKNPTRKGYSFKGWYTDSKFKKKITTIKKGAEGNYTLYAKWEKITVKKAAISSAKNSKKGQIVLNCKKLADVKGYEISYSTVKNFKKDVVTKDTKKNTYTIKKLKKGTTYYVKIRAYQLDSTGKKVYGKYSAVKKVKITK